MWNIICNNSLVKSAIIAWIMVLLAPRASMAHVGHTESERIQLSGPHPDKAALEAAFEQAASDYGVPAAILKAVAFQESRWVHSGPTIDYGYGIMHLVNNGYSRTLLEAAAITGLSVEELKTGPIENIRGGAALIARYAAETVGKPETLEDYWEALKRFSGLLKETQAKQAQEYYRIMADGAAATNNLGMEINLAPVPINMDRIGEGLQEGQSESTDYGPAIWNPADPSNYSTYRGVSIDRWVNHWIGAGTYAGTISWFKNPSSNVSAHFVIRKSDGELTQMVRIAHKAWHCGNWNARSIGIEHEATPSNPWPTSPSSPMLVNSANCCSYFCNQYGIPKTRTYIVGHNEVPGSSTACPGPLPWDTYMQLVTGTPPPPAWDATFVAESYPGSIEAGQTAIVWAEFTNTGTDAWHHDETFLGTTDPQDRSSPFCNIPNWDSCNRPTEVDQWEVTNGQVGRFTFIILAPDTPGTYVENYKLVREGITWFGPTISWTINVTASLGNLTGTVTNASNGAPIVGAAVSLSGVGDTTTNGSGVYNFNNLDAGSYTVSVTAAGFNPDSDAVNINAGATTTKNFALTPSDTEPPSTPTGLSANPTGPTTVELSWNPSSDNVGVVGYDVRRDSTIIGSSPTAGYTDNSATPDTTHTYEVRARDAVPNYSGWSDPATATTPALPPQPTVVFSDGFDGNLDNWSQGGSAFAYSASVNHGTYPGGGAAYCGVEEADQMHHLFARPFAQGTVTGWFWDGKGGWKSGVCGWTYRQSLCLRDPDGAAKMYLDNCFNQAVSNSDYFWRTVSESGNSGSVTYGTRNPNTDCNGAWIFFETAVTPNAPGASPPGAAVFKVTDGAGTSTANAELPPEFADYGIGRITLGLGYSSHGESFWDDVAFVAMPPDIPSMDAPTVVSTSQIVWSFSPADDNFFGWDLADDGGTILSAQYPAAGWLNRNATAWTESGLTANTEYMRKVKAWNGTLHSAYAQAVCACTLSVPPAAGSVTPDNDPVCAGDMVTWAAEGGFGPGKVQYYSYAWDQSAGHDFTGSEPVWSNGTISLQASEPGTWYLHVQGLNAADVPNGTFDYAVTAEDCAALAPADFDEDGDVDMEDFGHLQVCLTGTSIPQHESDCQDARLDEDLDVDQEDMAIFLGCLTGANIPADPGCAD